MRTYVKPPELVGRLLKQIAPDFDRGESLHGGWFDGIGLFARFTFYPCRLCIAEHLILHAR